jgi:hypothetical protein
VGSDVAVSSWMEDFFYRNRFPSTVGNTSSPSVACLSVLATWEAGFRRFTTKEPLVSPADAKGKKMRVFPNDMTCWIVESIGFAPVVLPVTEVYLAIQQGIVIGQENPTDTIYSLRFYLTPIASCLNLPGFTLVGLERVRYSRTVLRLITSLPTRSFAQRRELVSRRIR